MSKMDISNCKNIHLLKAYAMDKSDRNYKKRILVTKALSKIDSKEAKELLIILMSDPYSQVRKAAYKAKEKRKLRMESSMIMKKEINNMRIKDQMQKELFIFQKLGYMCKKADYINEFQNSYPDDIDYLCRIFQTDAEHPKITKKYVENYLRQSFVNGRLRYKINCGIYPDTRNLNNRD